jgi:hypothetical protein
MAQDQSTLFTAPEAQSRSLAGQGVVGQMITSPWFAGTWEVTQGWGQTDFDGEPEGHGAAHWHAGVDVGLDCGTVIELPMTLTGVARSFDNPGGYGTALVVLVDGGPGIVLGHLRQRLVDDGQVLQGGDQLAVSNNTGNSTGCHLHFEARPQDPKRPLGIAAYGADFDPSGWLLFAQGAPGGQAQLLATQQNPVAGAISSFVTTILAGGEVLLGGLLVVTGLTVAAWGARGGTAAGLAKATRDAVDAASRTRRAPRRPTRRAPSAAAEARVRPDLQHEPAPARPPAASARKALPAPKALPPPVAP